MAKCIDCGAEYERPSNRSARCLACRREHDRKWRADRKAAGNPVKTPQMSREWHRAYEAEYTKRPDVKKRKAAAARDRASNPAERHKHLARWKVRHAIESGELKRQPCFVCGCQDTQGHHPDYSRPLDVVWLCVPHHAQLHREAGAA